MKHLHISLESRSISKMAPEEPHPLSKIAYYSQVLLGAKLFIAGVQGDVDGADSGVQQGLDAGGGPGLGRGMDGAGQDHGQR